MNYHFVLIVLWGFTIFWLLLEAVSKESRGFLAHLSFLNISPYFTSLSLERLKYASSSTSIESGSIFREAFPHVFNSLFLIDSTTINHLAPGNSRGLMNNINYG